MKLLSAALLALVTTATPALAHEHPNDRARHGAYDASHGRGFDHRRGRDEGRRPEVQRATARFQGPSYQAFHRALDQSHRRMLRTSQPWEPRYRAWLIRARREHAAWHARWDREYDGRGPNYGAAVGMGGDTCRHWEEHGHDH